MVIKTWVYLGLLINIVFFGKGESERQILKLFIVEGVHNGIRDEWPYNEMERGK